MRLLIATVATALCCTAAVTASPPKLTTLIAETQVSLWRCQDQSALHRTAVSTDPWSLPRSTAYRRWVLQLWQGRLKACRTALHAHDVVVQRLDHGLRGSPMAGLGRILERVGRRYHVSPYFIAGVAATESTLGAAACANNRMNVWGLSSCGGGWYVPRWATWEEAISFYARYLVSTWPHATTTYHYSGYAACSSCWGAKTATHMRHLFGVTNSVVY